MYFRDGAFEAVESIEPCDFHVCRQ